MNPPLSATEDSASHGDAGNALLVAVTRLEAKLDVALAQHGAQIDEHGKDLADHEDRLRKIEARKTVSPAALWATVGSGVAAFGILAPYLANLMNGVH